MFRDDIQELTSIPVMDKMMDMVRVFAILGLWESNIPTSRDPETPRVKERKVKTVGRSKCHLMVGKVQK